MSFILKNNNPTISLKNLAKNNAQQSTLQNDDLKITVNNNEMSSQMIRKLHRYINEQKQCKTKLHQLQSTLKNSISPQRQCLMQQLLSKHEQISQLSRSQHIMNKQHLKLKQCSQSLRKSIQQQQKQLLQSIQHKHQLNSSITRVQNQINHLKTIHNELQITQTNKQQQIAEYNKQRQEEFIQYGQQFNKNKQRKQQQLQHANEYNTQFRDCLSKRLAVKDNLEQAIIGKTEQISQLQQQGSILKGQLFKLEQRYAEINQQKQQLLHQHELQQDQLSSIQMQNTQLKARLQILKHTLKQQTQLSNLLHNKIYHNHQLSQQSLEADQQANQMLQQLIRIKLQAQYASSRAKSSSKYDNSSQ